LDAPTERLVVRWEQSWRSAACGLTIATLVLFPLLNALAVESAYWLHWRTQDTFETLGAWLLVASVASLSLLLANVFGGVRLAEGLAALWLGSGGFFAAGALIKVGAFVQYAMRYRTASPWVAAVSATVLVAGAAWILHDRTRVERRYFQRAALALSPLVLVFLFNLGKAQIEHRELASASASKRPAPQRGAAGTPLRTVVLLFDELSADYLYGRDAIDLSELTALQKFLAESHVFSGAYLPGGHTGAAIPSLFGDLAHGPPIDSAVPRSTAVESAIGERGGLVALSARTGMDMRVFGWYVDYCTGIAAQASICRAISVYNARTLQAGFSLRNPLWTNLNLLPSEFPFGFVKVGPAVRMHRATYETAMEWFRDQLKQGDPDVIYVHVNVPHVPYIAEDFEGSKRARFVMTREAYIQQLRFVDKFLAFVTVELERSGHLARPTNVVVMSDHNARALTPDSEHEHVVFMERRSDDLKHAVDSRRIHAADLLADIFGRGAKSGQ
jgi:hypothetical protein